MPNSSQKYNAVQEDIETGSETKHSETTPAEPLASTIPNSTIATNVAHAPEDQGGAFGKKWGIYTTCLISFIGGGILGVGGLFSGNSGLMIAGAFFTSTAMVIAPSVAFVRTTQQEDRRRAAHYNGDHAQEIAAVQENSAVASAVLISENQRERAGRETTESTIPIVEATIISQPSANNLQGKTTSFERG